MDFLLSPKYKDFLRHRCKVEFLEGTTYAGKTTVGVVKFMFLVAESRQKIHILSGLDLGTIEKNIINKDLGILDIFSEVAHYYPNGHAETSLPHIIYETDEGEKIIYVLGYDNKSRWKKALGGQYGCLYIDEANIANMEYMREASMRCDYLMGTLNPDNPALPVYSEYINHSRPLERYKNDGPRELLDMLDKPAKEGWTWWFFGFDHNLGLSQEKKEQIITTVPVGTKIYKNKILGLRGKATGLVFSNFSRQRHVVSIEDARRLIQIRRSKTQKEYFETFSAGLDTAYSTQSPDTIAMTFIGITNCGNCYVLDERVYNNADISTPLAPSDTVEQFVAFLNRNEENWGFARHVFIDSADAGTITEFRKYKVKHGSEYDFQGAHKKMKIIDRIHLQLGWFATDNFFVVNTCENYMTELDSYSWRDDLDNTPEDANDHCINSVQYAWLPYKNKIGVRR